ncbi:hypothetical protein QUA81_32485 [Microcoleus sp. F6_B4]
MSSSTHCMSMGQSVGGINQSLSMCAPQSPVTVIQGSTPKQGSVVSQVTKTSQISSLNVLATDQVSSQSTSLNSSQVTQVSTQTAAPKGSSQSNSILATLIRNGVFSFLNVQSGNWFDPPTDYGFKYTTIGDSLFTQILDFPTGFSNPFSVTVKDILLGTNFTAGQSIDFAKYSAQLGNFLVGGVGVSEFSVTGINVDPTNPEAFPIKLEFNTETASFDQEAIEAVPEPLSFFGSVLGAGMMVTIRRWREAKSH